MLAAVRNWTFADNARALVAISRPDYRKGVVDDVSVSPLGVSDGPL